MTIKIIALLLLALSNWTIILMSASMGWYVIVNGIIVNIMLINLAHNNIIKSQKPVNTKCNHVPKRHVSVDKPFTYEPICYHCGIELQAVWSEKV